MVVLTVYCPTDFNLTLINMFSSPRAMQSTSCVPSAPRKPSQFARLIKKMEVESEKAEKEEDEPMEWVAPAAPQKLPRYNTGLEKLGLIPSKPRQHPPPPSTSHLDPSIARGMQGIGGVYRKLTFSPECPWAPKCQPKSKTVSVTNIRKLKL